MSRFRLSSLPCSFPTARALGYKALRQPVDSGALTFAHDVAVNPKRDSHVAVPQLIAYNRDRFASVEHYATDTMTDRVERFSGVPHLERNEQGSECLFAQLIIPVRTA